MTFLIFNKSCLQRILFHWKSCLWDILFSVLFGLLIHWYWIWFELKCSRSQWQNLLKTTMKKLSNKPFVRFNLARSKSRNTNSIPTKFIQTMYVITRNINITITRLVLILLRFHVVSSRLLPNTWHSQWGKETYRRPAKGQCTNEHHINRIAYQLGFIQKSDLRRIFFYKTCLQPGWIFFHKKIRPAAHFFNEKSSSWSFCGPFDFRFLILSTNSLVV